MSAEQDLPIEIDVRSVKALMDESADFVLFDCREADEHELVRIEGSTFIPMSELMVRVGELEPHREKHIVVHCHHGGRSLQVTQWLRSQGYSHVQNMTGGIDAWSIEIDPSLRRY